MHKLKYRSNEEKETFVKEFLASGKSKTIWCKEKGIPYSTLYEWLKTYDNTMSNVTFVPLKEKKIHSKEKPVDNTPIRNDNTSVLLEIGTFKIHVSESTSMPFLTELIKVVKSLHV